MASVILSNGVKVSDYGIPYIVAEMNSSHNGDIQIAKNMILKAKEAGASCVKFQSWTSKSLYSNSYYASNSIQKRIIDKFSLSKSELLELSKYADSLHIDFSSTPYCNKEVDFLVHECNVPYIKVASMDINNIPYLKYIAAKNKPIVLSTGMSELYEIKTAVNAIRDVGNQNIIILHCISTYPTNINNVNLNNIKGLREFFTNYPIGFSDHTIGYDIAIASIALGSALLEKHFTLNKKIVGMDNHMALEPEEFSCLVNGCIDTYNAMGKKERIVNKDELKQRAKMRRSIVANRYLRAGEVIKMEDLDFRRPATGISPDKFYMLIGAVLKNDIKEGWEITELDI